MIFIGNTKSRLCVGCSLFFILMSWLVLEGRIESDDELNMVLGLAVIPVSLFIYFFAWTMYKYAMGRIIVTISAVGLVLLILFLFL